MTDRSSAMNTSANRGRNNNPLNSSSGSQQQQVSFRGTAADLDLEEARTANFASVEKKIETSTEPGGGATTPGGGGSAAGGILKGRGAKNFRNIALRVKMAQRVQPKQRRKNSHRASMAYNMMDAMSAKSTKHLNALFDEDLDEEDDDDDESDVDDSETEVEEAALAGEIEKTDDENNNNNEKTPLLVPHRGHNSRHSSSASRGTAACKLKLAKKRRNRNIRRLKRLFATLTDPRFLLRVLLVFLTSPAVVLGVPFAAAAWIAYYYLGNPVSPDFLPGPCSLAWWLNFVARLSVTLTLARLTHNVVRETVFWIRRQGIMAASLPALVAAQGRHWSARTFFWGMWNLILLHGDNKFQVHWLYWTGYEIYSHEGNPNDSYVLGSDLYLRILIVMLVLGLASVFKKVFTDVHFGVRQVAEFKPKLNQMLAEAVLMTELGLLAEDIDAALEHQQGQQGADLSGILQGSDEKPLLTRAEVMDIGFEHYEEGEEDGAAAHAGAATDGQQQQQRGGAVETKNEGDNYEEVLATGNEGQQQQRHLSMSPDGSIRVKHKLDNWEEPESRLDEDANNTTTFSDVLLFKRALHFMKDAYPFGEPYGPAGTRDECLDSAHRVYRRLLKLTPKREDLPFNTIAAIATDLNGNEDPAKKDALRMIFNPGDNNEVTLLMFLRACDEVYKRTRFFYAMVSNASVIDKALELIFSWIYWFVLIMILLSILKINPWALLVPLTSLLVSLSFALGPTLSKYVEGIFFIAVCRPYDLGDRVVIIGAVNIQNPGVAASWFVEDMNLITTTLRNALSNEVSQVHNWSIAGARIVNCNRSPHATVYFEMKMHMSACSDAKLNELRSTLEKYVRTNHRKWQSMAFCRHDDFDSNLEQATFAFSFIHRKGWQDTLTILTDRAQLKKFIGETAKGLNVTFRGIPNRSILYSGGDLVDGYLKGFKQDMLSKDNLVNRRGRIGPSEALVDYAATGQQQPALKED